MFKQQFNQLADEIMAQGFDDETASHFAALLGDTPVRDQADNIVVMDGKVILAVLKPLKFFGP